jgi:hypothetical protein
MNRRAFQPVTNKVNVPVGLLLEVRTYVVINRAYPSVENFNERPFFFLKNQFGHPPILIYVF